MTTWRNFIKPQLTLATLEQVPGISPEAAPAEPAPPPAPPRRGFFVSVDERCNFLGVECFGGLTEGDYALLCFASAHTYAAHAYRAAEALTREKGAADGGESAD